MKIKLKNERVKFCVKKDVSFKDRMDALRTAAELCFTHDDNGEIKSYCPDLMDIAFAYCVLTLYTDIDEEKMTLENLWAACADKGIFMEIVFRANDSYYALRCDLEAIVDTMRDNVRRNDPWSKLAYEISDLVHKIGDEYAGIDASVLTDLADKLNNMKESDIIDVILSKKEADAT